MTAKPALSAELDRLRAENKVLREALAHCQEWAHQIAHDERVCGWVHANDYGLYCLLADCPVDFDEALAAVRPEEKVETRRK